MNAYNEKQLQNPSKGNNIFDKYVGKKQEVTELKIKFLETFYFRYS
jgi:hypothetical protein